MSFNSEVLCKMVSIAICPTNPTLTQHVYIIVYNAINRECFANLSIRALLLCAQTCLQRPRQLDAREVTIDHITPFFPPFFSVLKARVFVRERVQRLQAAGVRPTLKLSGKPFAADASSADQGRVTQRTSRARKSYLLPTRCVRRF